MHFTKLRLAGFKSFVEPAEFGIEPGLTGIVGPNGCGKSNLVEALQWAMGETSARRLRGGEMDDVIFGGTSTRSARDIASVTIWLDNADRRAPALLNDTDELQIERKIERGKGSTYRVNGREQRARDVQLLFADAAAGAGSSALVGQGRIGWLINAKPTERRALLEEAAGISGLQSRRHEAELKLAAAEQNLTRLDDVAQNLRQQIERLQRQARQASRYRELSAGLRVAEAQALHRLHQDRTRRHHDANERLAAGHKQVEANKIAAAEAEAARITAAEAVAPVRESAAEAIRISERLVLERDAMRAELRRVNEQLRDLAMRLVQVERDREREKGLVGEAEAAIQRLADEAVRIDAERGEEATAQEKSAAELRTASTARARIENDLNAATAQAAKREAERVAMQRRLMSIEERRQRLVRQQHEAEARSRELDLLAISPEKLEAARTETRDAESAIESARAQGEAAERASRDAEAAERGLREPVQRAERQGFTLKAEIDALTRLVQSGIGGHAPALDRIKAKRGFETALGAVLGDDLLASLESKAPIHWSDAELDTAGDAKLPDGAEPFSAQVTVPAVMARRLAQIGLVADAATGNRLRPLLKPGQRLVTRDGMVWRWDGLTQAAGAPTAAATRLAQRNRLETLQEDHRQAMAVLTEAQAQHKTGLAAIDAARQAEIQSREAMRLATARAGTARQAEAQLVQQAQAAETRRQAALESLKRVATDMAELDEQAADAQAEQARLPDPAESRAEVDRLKQDIEGARETERLHQRALDHLVSQAQARRLRQDSIQHETRAWRDRTASAVAQVQRLDERHQDLTTESASLADRPEALTQGLAQLDEAIEAAKQANAATSQALALAEGAARDAEAAQSLATRGLIEARESRIRAEAALEQAVEALDEARRRIHEAFECPPSLLGQAARLDSATLNAEGRSAADLDAQVDQLKRQRDAIGPVNLMAESEMTEMQAELTSIETETADLRAAIARLRQGIGQLNAEGRERLLAAFQVINGHFSTLFQQLFGGGRAHLELIQHESDPLMAGIEIMASPPGKKLQSLTLLSGGERALTALALVFAMFLTNPAPICVLDEVDAPLDDANVERFCALVRDIAARTGTRFLVITHHRVSMARMDRLYGVTMVERGISRLVSVDLVEADRIRESA